MSDIRRKFVPGRGTLICKSTLTKRLGFDRWDEKERIVLRRVKAVEVYRCGGLSEIYSGPEPVTAEIQTDRGELVLNSRMDQKPV